jgi:hypothetical protein
VGSTWPTGRDDMHRDPVSSKVVPWRRRRSCSLAYGSWSFGRSPWSGWLSVRMSLDISDVTVWGGLVRPQPVVKMYPSLVPRQESPG